MIDSQLFGHRRGSFTGAYENVPGLVRAADGGTLLLDEVGELDLQTQPKLLRLLENYEVQPLGAARPVTVDVRVIAATNADLSERVREGRFREDLFFRLNAVRTRSFRRCASGATTSRRWCTTSCAATEPTTAGRTSSWPTGRCSASCGASGRGTCGSCRTRFDGSAALADDHTTITPEHLSAEVRQDGDGIGRVAVPRGRPRPCR